MLTMECNKGRTQTHYEFGLNVTVKQWGRKGLNVRFPATNP